MARTFKVPAAWMKATVIGPCKVVPCVNAKCPTEKVTRAWMFYRVYKHGKPRGDYGDKAGAIRAAKAMV